MPAKTGKSGLLAKYGEALQRAHEAHKTDETEFSQFGELPAGIDGGIAQLVECKFDVYKSGDNVGEYYFYAAGAVVSPEEFTNRKGIQFHIKGLRTSVMEPLCDTPSRGRQTQDEHLKYILNELRKLGVDTPSIGADDLEGVAAALREAAPYFRFRTWAGEKQILQNTNGQIYVVDEDSKKVRGGPYLNEAAALQAFQYAGKEPRTNHQWNGLVQYTADGPGAGVNDKAATNGAHPAPAAQTPPPATPPASRPAPAPATAPQPPAAPAVDLSAALDQLVAQATALNTAAQDQLTKMAEEKGVTEAEIEAAADWVAVAALIRGAGKPAAPTPATNPATAVAPEWQPNLEEFYGYRPFDNKRKRKSDRVVECEVIGVDPAAKTCTLRNNENQKVTYQSIPWGDLESAPTPAGK